MKQGGGKRATLGVRFCASRKKYPADMFSELLAENYLLKHHQLGSVCQFVKKQW
jgi:hypothetical protein